MSLLRKNIFLLLMISALCTLSACSLNLKEAEVKSAPRNNVVVNFNANSSIKKINAVRKKHFLNTFKLDPRLMKAAQNHAKLMGTTGRFGHEFGPKTKFKRRIFAVGFDNSAGENLGVGYTSIEAAIDGWLNSPGHRKILLKRNYKLGGIAYARNTSGKNPRLNHFWVLIVGEG